MRAAPHPLRTSLYSSLTCEYRSYSDDIDGAGLDPVARLPGVVQKAARRIVPRSDSVSGHRPTLAVPVHHRFDDFLTNPLSVHTKTDEYDFFLDQVDVHCERVVLVARPQSRGLRL
jgi:hypothetical protein